jgi:hypothetical protein
MKQEVHRQESGRGEKRVSRPPYETFKRATCKGSYALGTACGSCEACEWERGQNLVALLQSLIARWRKSADKAEMHIGDHGMEVENETHMRDMRKCAEEIEALLRAPSTSPAPPKETFDGP